MRACGRDTPVAPQLSRCAQRLSLQLSWSPWGMVIDATESAWKPIPFEGMGASPHELLDYFIDTRMQAIQP